MSNRNSSRTSSARRSSTSNRSGGTGGSGRSTGSESSSRNVYDVTRKGVYRREHRLNRIGMGIRRGDTRHGDTSNVVLWKPTDSEGPARRFVLTLSEARALKAFLERELQTLAR